VESIKGIDLRYEERPLSSFFEKNIDLGLVSHNWDEEEEFAKGIRPINLSAALKCAILNVLLQGLGLWW
jgi:hypothetical protein